MADSILRLRVESQEYDNKLKRAAEGLNRYAEQCRKAGGTLESVEKDTLDFVKALGQMETTSKTVRGSLGEMTKVFTEMKMQYKQLTDAEKSAPYGKALAQSLDQLKGRINQAQSDLKSINQELQGGSGKFGQFGSVIDGLGQKMGVNANLTELLTSKTALLSAGIGAAGAIVGKATQEWAKYNAELAKQDQITTVTTGLKGADSDRMTNQARALTDTYGVDFREAINAANTLMTQFGQTGEQAMSLISDGMQGMIQGDGPKLLSMIQQYAPAFRDAGVSASQLVAVIQNSEGGIFTDQNMNAIVMGIKNIRLMTNATSEALGKLGIDGQKMSQQLRDGSLTIFDALKQVATQIQSVNSNSQAAGEVMQQVFGRQGAMSGTKLGEAIATLNTNLEETKRQTGEVGDAYNDLYEANVKLNAAIRDCFEYDGWDQMATGIKANLVNALASVLDYLGKIKGALGGFSVGQQQGNTRNGGGQFIDRAVDRLRGGSTPGKQRLYTRQIQAYSGKILDINDQIRQIQEKAAQDMDGNMAVVYEKQIRNLENRKQAIQRNMAEYDKRAQAVLNGTDTKTKDPIFNPTKHTGGKKTPEYIPLEGSIDAQTKKVQDLQKAWRAAADDTSREEIKKQIDEAQFALDKMLGKVKDRPKMEAVEMKLPEGGIGSLVQDTRTRQENGLAVLKQKIKLEIDQEALKADTNTLQTILKDAMQNGIDGMDFQLMGLGDEIAKGFNITDEKWSEIIEQYNAKLKEKGLGPLNIDLATGKTDTNKGVKASDDLSKINQDVSKITSGIGGIFSGIQQMGIEIPEGISEMLGVLQGITTIMTAITTILSVIEATSSVTAATSAVKAIPVVGWLMANGGVVHAEGGYKVPGNHMSGDMVPAMLNSGELVLNKAQQGNLASQLKDGEGRGGYTPSHISGEQIWIALNRYTKRTGRGEMVTWK